MLAHPPRERLLVTGRPPPFDNRTVLAEGAR